MKDLSGRVALLIRFGYDGARFYGLQPQRDLPTAGGALAERILAAAGQRQKGLAFSARTDRGVHCGINLATCWYPAAELDVDGFRARLTAAGDDGLVVHGVDVVPPTVHARNISRGKHYRYVVVDNADPDALDDVHAWRVVPALDVERMQQVARSLLGTHDFSSLRGSGCSAASTEKSLYRFDVTRADDGRIVVDVVGDAFLRHMLRNLAGLLVEVGSGWRDVDVGAVLAARHRQAAGLMAPAAGLTLVAVGCAWPLDGSRRLPETPPDDVFVAGRGGTALVMLDEA